MVWNWLRRVDLRNRFDSGFAGGRVADQGNWMDLRLGRSFYHRECRLPLDEAFQTLR